MSWTCISTPWRGCVLPFMALASVLWLIPGRGVTQEQAAIPGARPPASEIRVYQAKYLKAGEAARTINGIWGGRLGGPQLRVSVDEGTNSVIVVGTLEDTVSIGTLLSKLDVPSSRNQSKSSVRVFPLIHTQADLGLTKALGLILAKGSFEVDPSRNQVVVTGEEKVLGEAEKLLQRLDTPGSQPKTAEMQVRLVWLASGPARKEARKPPEDMKAIIAELAKMGIEELSLVTQTLVTALPNTQFQIEGLAGLDSPCRLSVSGTLMSNPGEITDRLQISVTATQATVTPPIIVNPIARLDTVITTVPGHSIVLGMTPTATSTSVFVVQILHRK